jgi:hypothetical protein
MKGRKRKPGIGGLMLLAAIFFFIAASFLLWALVNGVNSADPLSLLPILVMLVIIALGYRFIARQREKIESGMPLEDEFSRRAKHKAAYYAFLAGIWFNLILAWLIDEGKIAMLPRHALFSSMLAMTVVFVAAWLYYTKKGFVE